jgi:hypothetical protein
MPEKVAGRKEQIRGCSLNKTLPATSHIPKTYSILLNKLNEHAGIVYPCLSRESEDFAG